MWVALQAPDPVGVEDIFGMTIALLQSAGVWGLVQTLFTAFMVLIVTSFVFRILWR